MLIVKVKLGKKWNDHEKGTIVEVDELRAKWLRDNGFEEEAFKKDEVSKKVKEKHA